MQGENGNYSGVYVKVSGESVNTQNEKNEECRERKE